MVDGLDEAMGGREGWAVGGGREDDVIVVAGFCGM